MIPRTCVSEPGGAGKKPLRLGFRAREGTAAGGQRLGNTPPSSRFERGRGLVVALMGVGGSKMAVGGCGSRRVSSL